jgi:hypothetical protein
MTVNPEKMAHLSMRRIRQAPLSSAFSLNTQTTEP